NRWRLRPHQQQRHCRDEQGCEGDDEHVPWPPPVRTQKRVTARELRPGLANSLDEVIALLAQPQRRQPAPQSPQCLAGLLFRRFVAGWAAHFLGVGARLLRRLLGLVRPFWELALPFGGFLPALAKVLGGLLGVSELFRHRLAPRLDQSRLQAAELAEDAL